MSESRSSTGPSTGVKNFLQQFSVQEISAPLTLLQQEQMADDLVRSIKTSTEGKLPDYLEEFRRIYEGPNHLEAKLPIMSQLTPRSKRKLAVLPRPNEAELQKIRNIEKLTKEKAGRRLYEDIGKKNTIPKSQQQLIAEAIVVPEPSQLGPLIPKNVQADVTNNKAADYYQAVDQHKRHNTDQMEKLQRLFGIKQPQPQPPKPTTSSSISSGANNLSRSGSSQRVIRTNSLRLQPMAVQAQPPPSSSTPLLSMTYNPLSLGTDPLPAKRYQHVQAEGRRVGRHEAFIKDFTIKVYDEMGIDLNKEFNRLRNHTHHIQVFLLHLYHAKLRAGLVKWKQVIKQMKELTVQTAARRVYRAFRYHQFMNQINIRVERRTIAKFLEEKRRIENEIFMNRTASTITRYLNHYVKMKRIKHLVRIRQSATKLQSLFRGRKGRKFALVRKIRMLRVNGAALMIQCMYRRRLAVRKVVLARKMKFVHEWIYEMEQKSVLHKQVFMEMGAVSYISKAYRTYLIKKRLFKLIFYNHFVKAITIQRYYRGCATRKMHRVRMVNKRKLEALQFQKAIIIGKYVRRYLAQCQLDRMFDEKDAIHGEKYNLKLLKLAQGETMAFVCKKYVHRWKHWYFFGKKYKIYNEKAAMIQRVYRGYHGRQRAYFVRIMNSVRVIHKLQMKRYRAIKKIQKVWRGYMTRLRLYRIRRENVIVTIQCAFRVHMAILRFKGMKKLNRSASFITKALMRITVKHRFHLKYNREQYLGNAVKPLQRFFRRIKGRRILANLLIRTRMLTEHNLINQIHFIHLLTSVQLQILIETIPKAIHHRFYVVSNKDCLCLGPLQALFVVGICGNKNRTDQQTLATNKMDNNSLVKFLNKIDGMTDKDPTKVAPNPAGGVIVAPPKRKAYANGICAVMSSAEKERTYLKPSTLDSALLSEVLLSDVPLPNIQHKLSNMEIDIIFSKSKSMQNASHKLSYKEFLRCMDLIAGLHYQSEGVIGSSGEPETKESEKTAKALPAEDAGAADDVVDPEDLAEEMMDESLKAVKEIYDDQQPFDLKKYVAANVKAINTRSNYFHPDRIRADPAVVMQDMRLALVLRLLIFLREEEFAQSVFTWLDVESRARLGLFVTRIQCIVRKKLAWRRYQRTLAAKIEKDRQAGIARNVIKIQSVIRSFIWKRRVMKIAQRVLRKFIPASGNPYWFHPMTKVKSHEKPRILRGCDCYSLALPEQGLENVVKCYSCQIRPAVLNCNQCEDSMCRVCFDSLHCKGERTKHNYTKITMCSYCKYQMATKTCVTCVVEKPKSGNLKQSLSPADRGFFCDTCFLHEHDRFQQSLESNSTYRKQVKVLLQNSKEAYLVRNYLQQRIQTAHQYDSLTQDCEECRSLSASWRCFDCQQVYCHRCLISFHSMNRHFASHQVELLPYYTKEMHVSFRKDVARQEFLQQLEKMKARLELEKQELHFQMAIVIQAWWRMIYIGWLGRRHMKKQRKKQRSAYRLRKHEDATERSTFKYRFWGQLGYSRPLVSDTREERTLRTLPWYKRPLAKEFIKQNKEDWGWYRVSRTVPRKGIYKVGFDVGKIDELEDQAKNGGYRLPGRVIVKMAERSFTTTCDLRNFLTPGELVRIRNRLFGVTAVDAESVKLNRLWREAENNPRGEVMYRVPTYRNEPKRFLFKMRYLAYDLTIGNPLTQVSLYIYKAYSLRMMAFSMYMSQLNKKNKNMEEAADWKRSAMKYMDSARWATSYFSTGDAFMNLSSVTKEEADRRAEQKRQVQRRKMSQTGSGNREYSDDDEDIDPDDDDSDSQQSKSGSANKKKRRGRKSGGLQTDEHGDDLDQEVDRFGDIKSKPSSRNSRRSGSRGGRRSGKVTPAGSDSEDSGSVRISTRKSFLGSMSALSSTGASTSKSKDKQSEMENASHETKKKKRTKGKKVTKPSQPWYASAEQLAERKLREDKMTEADLAAEAGDWKESVDIMTENVYYININTNEMMTTIPRSIAAKRHIEFEGSKNKKAYDEAQNRIKRLEKVTKHRLMFTGGRRK